MPGKKQKMQINYSVLRQSLDFNCDKMNSWESALLPRLMTLHAGRREAVFAHSVMFAL